MIKSIITLIFSLAIFQISYSQENANKDVKENIKTARYDIIVNFNKTYKDLLLPKEEIKSIAQKRNIPIFLELENNVTATLQYFDESNFPIYYSTKNVGAANSVGATALRPGGDLGLNLTGNGITVGIYDQTRPKPDHVEFGNRLTQIDGSSENLSNHATHVTGTVLASGVNSGARGMAYEATGWAFNWDSDLSKMNANAYDPVEKNNGHIVSNHSYGIVTGWYRNSSGAWVWSGNPSVSPEEDYRFGFYSTKSKGLDDLAFAKPYYTIVWAAGNDRNDVGDGTRPPDGPEDTIGPEGVAKNVITVGAVNSVSSYTGPTSVAMSSFSSWGPTDDGRIKPDLVGVGVNVFSTTIANGGTTDSYGSLSGTSMASPNVAGSLVLLQQLYKERNNNDFMLAATLKALILNTTKEAGQHDGPDYVFGWGLLDAKAAAEIILNEDGSSNLIREEVLSNGSTYEFEFISDGVTPIRATIAWTDPSGNVSPISLNPTDLKLVNDLDLRIFDDQGKEFFPWSLDPSRGATGPARQTEDNFRDNIEQVFIASPEARKYTISVSHKGNLVNGGQNFSLVMTAGSLQGSTETLYWIGPDNGQWDDVNNWSFSREGSSSNKLPESGTRVVFDGKVSLVALNNQVEISSLNVFGDSNVEIDLNGNNIQVRDGLRIAGNATLIKNGKITFATESNNTQLISLINTEFDGVELIIDQGLWSLLESTTLDELTINSSLSVTPTHLRINKLSINNTGSLAGAIQELDFKKKVEITSEAFFSSNLRFNFTGVESSEFVNSSTRPIREVIMSGSGILMFQSESPVDRLILSGGIFIQNSEMLPVNYLQFRNGGDLKLGDRNSILVQENIESTNSGNNRSVISSENRGVIIHDLYKKYCLEGVDVINVDLQGDAIINLGENSQIVNSNNWIQLRCEDVLFADFRVDYACLGGVTEFINLSEGEIDNYIWLINGEQVSSGQNLFFQFENTGLFEVDLIISSGEFETQIQKVVNVATSNLAKPNIVINGDLLTSQSPGERYQWYFNGSPIEGATSRSYQTTGDGSYQVAIFGGNCNRISDPVIITAIVQQEPDLSRFGVFVGPNPTNGMINVAISNEYIGEIEIDVLDVTGKLIRNQGIYKADQDLEIELQLIGPKGLYLLLIKTNNYILRKKIIKN
ncbi:Por secretion system C-terminal sorting domain-containing protein [Belliella buryatensis]|uniref:Por secretion system C-terminal sorting domain-containing protein n=1 Tax=Belliella buryatensis TaxID=1500549 RepID=A0A239DTA7_9BACT|nr:S8 family serine peptidase [Belliella buryatensis]SNS35459.1 Por secretion system C-terminal sorting domain-containing protein [Belliella buryatensis]